MPPSLTLRTPVLLTLLLALATLGLLSFSLLLSLRVTRDVYVLWALVGSLGLGVLLVGLAALALAGERLPGAVHLPPAAVRLVPVAALGLSLYAFLPTVPAAALALALLALAAADLRWLQGRALPYLLAAAAAALATWLLHAFPLDPLQSDVLPSIRAAAGSLLDGDDPYQRDYSPITHNPFFYLPLQFGVYLPPVAAGLDPRWTNVLLAGAAPLLVHLAYGRRDAAEPLFLLYWPLVLGPIAFAQAQAGQVLFYWSAVAALGVALLRGRWLLAAVALGVALATRQTSVLLAAALAVGLLGRVPRRTYLTALAIGAGLSLVTLLPFELWHGGFFDAVFFDRPSAALRLGIVHDGNPYNQIALANALGWCGLAGDLGALQLTVAGVCLAGLWLARRRGLADVLLLAGLMYMSVVTVRMVAHLYYYYPGLLLVGLSVAARVSRPAARRSAPAAASAPPACPGTPGPA